MLLLLFESYCRFCWCHQNAIQVYCKCTFWCAALRLFALISILLLNFLLTLSESNKVHNILEAIKLHIWFISVAWVYWCVSYYFLIIFKCFYTSISSHYPYDKNCGYLIHSVFLSPFVFQIIVQLIFYVSSKDCYCPCSWASVEKTSCV